MSEHQQWNNAIDAALKAIETAPVFTKQNLGPKADNEKIIVIDICLKRVEALRKI